MKILILGGNGFIGSAIAGAALFKGHEVTCLGRNINSAKQRLPGCHWHTVDIAKMRDPLQWHSLIAGHDVIINAAGALQQSPRDELPAMQHLAMNALYEAAQKIQNIRIVQISAGISGKAAETNFLKTKNAADQALKQSGIHHTILRPTLVIGRNAHGGSALIRSIAAFPLLLPISFPDAKCQVANLDDLCQITIDASEGKMGDDGDYAVSNNEILPLEEITIAHRVWLGLPNERIWRVPNSLAKGIALLADCAGWFGWRSPMRSTALLVLADGVQSAPTIKQLPTRSLAETLASNPAGVQDVWFARLYLLKPILLSCLIIFWITSGIIALWQFDATVALATNAGIEFHTAKAITLATSLADIILGCLLMFQRLAKQALLGMILLGLAYMASAAMLQPELWLNPLGPMIKVFPILLAQVMALAILDER